MVAGGVLHRYQRERKARPPHGSFKAGLFSAGGDDELSAFDSSCFALVSVGFKPSRPPGLDSAEFRADVVHNDPHPRNNTRAFSNVVSLVSKLQRGSWHLSTDLAFGEGYFDQSDVWGLNRMPIYDLSDRVQLVMR